MENCSTGSALGGVEQDQASYIFLLVIVIDYISKLFPAFLTLPYLVLLGENGLGPVEDLCHCIEER